MKTYRLPPAFYDDHRSRDLPEKGETRIVRETKKAVFVEMDADAFDDLRADAAYYADEMIAAGADSSLFGTISSARATRRALDKQGRPE